MEYKIGARTKDCDWVEEMILTCESECWANLGNEKDDSLTTTLLEINENFANRI